MTGHPTSMGETLPTPETYLDVGRMPDGRYCVQFIKDRAVPRTSYTSNAGDVVKQAQRAGDIPIRTDDEELRRLCSDRKIKLL